MTKKQATKQAQADETTRRGYWARPVHTSLAAHVIESFVTTDGVGAEIVVCKVCFGRASRPVEVVLTVDEALAADVIEKSS